ncbi:MAG: DUF1015 domain-containing protein [Candidatus Omnitrophota bacterium]
MADIFPFHGLRYNDKKVKNTNKVFAPPYDVISEKEQDKLYSEHPHNVIRLILGKQSAKDTAKDNRYTRAASCFSKWIDDEIMVLDEKPSIYVYVQDYVTVEGVAKQRIGFFARMKFDDKEEGCLPHELTLAKPKVDRLKLMRAVQANLSPIFSFYLDPKNAVEAVLKPYIKKKAIIDFKDKENIRHRFWQIDDPKAIQKVRKLMRAKRIFIADGHHRYEVSRTYRDEMIAKGNTAIDGYNYCMIYFTGFNEENLSVLPTHRLVKGITNIDDKIKDIEEYFEKKKCKNLSEMLSRQSKSKGFTLGMYYQGGFYTLAMKSKALLNNLMKDAPEQWRNLDVAMLNKVVFEHIFKLNEKQKEEKISYTRDPEFAVTAVKKKLADVSFFPNTTKPEQVRKIASSGHRMPQKSTYFYPKPITGLVIHKF